MAIYARYEGGVVDGVNDFWNGLNGAEGQPKIWE
jgi:hypothetical protein